MRGNFVEGKVTTRGIFRQGRGPTASLLGKLDTTDIQPTASQFCAERGFDISLIGAPVLADFLCSITDGSTRPESALRNTCAALAIYYDTRRIENPLNTPAFVHLKVALVKSGTTAPMR